MKTVTVEYKVYPYNELSEEAKEKVRQWYLEGRPEFIFTEDCMKDLKNLFGRDIDLDVQYSLAYCQGDGFNIYGKINAKNIFNCLENHYGGTQLAEFENVLTEKEKKTILNYQDICGQIEIPMNRHYCYSLADYIDIADNWQWDLEYSGYKNINVEALKKFEKLVKGIFETLCDSYETMGYEYFYEISDEDLAECCEANGYEFMEDGTIF